MDELKLKSFTLTRYWHNPRANPAQTRTHLISYKFSRTGIRMRMRSGELALPFAIRASTGRNCGTEAETTFRPDQTKPNQTKPSPFESSRVESRCARELSA